MVPPPPPIRACPQLEALKEQCTLLCRQRPYDENHADYLIGEFRWSKRKIINVPPPPPARKKEISQHFPNVPIFICL